MQEALRQEANLACTLGVHSRRGASLRQEANTGVALERVRAATAAGAHTLLLLKLQQHWRCRGSGQVTPQLHAAVACPLFTLGVSLAVAAVARRHASCTCRHLMLTYSAPPSWRLHARANRAHAAAVAAVSGRHASALTLGVHSRRAVVSRLLILEKE